MRVLLVAGGWSPEREVSLSGSKVVHQALLRLGHEVTFYDPANTEEAPDLADLADSINTCGKHSGALNKLLELGEKNDFAFINLHGSPGEDGLIQAMLESVGCPYQGSDPRGSFLALHKAASKHIFRKSGLLTPDWEYLTSRPDSNWQTSLTFPLFAKANTGGSSLHLHRVTKPEKLNAVLDEIFASGAEVILEPLIEGKELTCPVLGDKALPPILIEPVMGDFFDYESKYRSGGAREICPAPLSPQVLAKIQEDSLTAHRALGLRGYSRADYILTPDGKCYLLEVNTLPGMTATSLVPREARTIGLDFGQLLECLINLGLADCGKK